MSIWRDPTFCHRGPPLGFILIGIGGAVIAVGVLLWLFIR